MLSSEINAYLKQISAYMITVAFLDNLWLFHLLMHFTSELQTPITFLFVNENIKRGYAFS